MGMGDANAGTVEVDVVGDFNKFERDMRGKGRTAGSTFGNSFGNSFGSTMARVGGAAVAGAFLKSTIDQASDLAESTNVVGLAFGDARGKVDEFGADAADNIGMTTAAFNQLAGQLGNIQRGLGATNAAAADSSLELIGRAADIGSAWNDSTENVTNAIISGFTGSTEPLRKYGVMISEADIKTQAVTQGIAATGEELTKEQRRLTLVSMILEQTNNVAGDFKNTQDGVANSTKTLTAMWGDMQAELGMALLPILSAVLKVMRSLGPDGMKMVILIGGGILVFTRLAMAAQAFSGALTLLAANPWVLAALAIIAVGVLIWRNWDTVRAALGITWDWLTERLGQLAGWFSTAGGIMSEAFNGAAMFISSTAQGIGSTFETWVIAPIRTIIDLFTSLPETASTAWESVKGAIGAAADWIVTKLGELRAAADSALGPLDEIVGAGAGLVGKGLGLLGFDDGGVVPGPRGSPRIILAHGGETVVPTHKAGAMAAGNLDNLAAGGGLNVTTNLTVDRDISEGKFRAMLEDASTELVRVAQREVDRRRRAQGSARGGLAT